MLTKIYIVNAMVFPVVMYGCESWTIKKAEHWKIDAFELWCWRDSWESVRVQGDPTSPSERKSVLNIYWKDWCWSWNTLATWCEELTHFKRPWCWERLKAGGEGDDRGWDSWMVSLTQWTWVWVNSRSWWWTGRPGVHGVAKSWTWLSDWTELNWTLINPEYSLEGLVLNLKLQYFDHLMWRSNSFEKTLMLGRLKAGREGDDRGWDGWMASLIPWTWVWFGDGQGSLACCGPWGLRELDTAEWLEWTELRSHFKNSLCGNCVNYALGCLSSTRYC